MPARSTRRRLRRESSSDHIEEENDPLQQIRADDVDNEEDSEEELQPVSKKTATIKKEKKSRVSRGGVQDSAAGPSDANGNDEGGRIDIENFHDQPLDKKEGSKLHGIAQDWEMIRKQIHSSSFRLIKDVAVSLADVMEGEEAEETLDKVDGIMKKLLDIDHEMRSHEETLSSLHQALVRGETVNNVLTTYETEVRQRLDEYKDQTTRQKYATTDAYVEFKQGIYEVQNPGAAIPPINDFVPREEGDPSDDEDELEVGGVTQDYKCPITLMPLKDPMTSNACGHSYSRAAIQEFLRMAGNTGKACPASGCNKRITMANLRVDKELEKKVKMLARRQQRQQEDEKEDEDEVIE